MLKKLLKYDMNKMRGFWKVSRVLLPCLAFAVPLSIRFASSSIFGDEDLEICFDIIAGMIAVFGVIAIIALGIINAVFVAKRMSNDFFSDTAQLTFTLPVKRDDLFLSKFLNSLIWVTAYNVAVIFTVLVCMLIIPVPDNGIISTAAFDAVRAFLVDMSSVNNALFQLLMILTVLLILEFNVFMANFLNYCVIKCHSAGGIGMYLGVMYGGFFVIVLLIAISVSGFSLVEAEASATSSNVFLLLATLSLCVIFAVLNFGLFFSARDKLKYDLNLS